MAIHLTVNNASLDVTPRPGPPAPTLFSGTYLSNFSEVSILSDPQ